MNNNEKVICWIKNKLKSENITQKEFAIKEGIHFVTLNRWLSGHRKVSKLWQRLFALKYPKVFK